MKKAMVLPLMLSIVSWCLASSDLSPGSVITGDKSTTTQVEPDETEIRQAMVNFIEGLTEHPPRHVDLQLLDENDKDLFLDRLGVTVAKSATGWHFLGSYISTSLVSALNTAGLLPENVKVVELRNFFYVYYYVP